MSASGSIAGEGSDMRINTTLVINSKGGSGKTTVTTNLASYFAARNIPTTIMDYDPQGSCLNWLRLRPALATRIHGANAAHQRGGRLRSVEMHVPAETRQLIIDGKIRARDARLAVLANRVRSSMPVYQPLERFLSSLSLAFLTRLGDSDVYVKAAETGVGIFDLDASVSAAERQAFMPIVEWIDGEQKPRVDTKVIELAAPAGLKAAAASAGSKGTAVPVHGSPRPAFSWIHSWARPGR